MRERGIYFNSEMVRAVMEGRKVQTRRVVKWRALKKGLNINFTGLRAAEEPSGWVIESDTRNSSEWRCDLTPCPFGAVGDRLWVRETWMPDAPRDGTWADVSFYGCKGSPLSMIPKRYRKPEHCIHRASWEGSEMVGWTPSIHMPRWASRITLEITGVRVERLQDISEADAKAEGLAEITKDGSLFKFGIPDRDGYPGTDDQGWPWTEWERNPVDAYRKLWQSIYGEESWQAKPWVWVIEFKRVEGE